MQDGAATIQLSGLTLIAGTFREVVKSFLAGNFQSNGFKRCVHKLRSVIRQPPLATSAGALFRLFVNLNFQILRWNVGPPAADYSLRSMRWTNPGAH
jgi:hypothetical protein